MYPVISRRSGGLSIGVNLSPDGVCNFDCVYCQVDRSVEPRVREVEPARLRDELSRMIVDAKDGLLFKDAAFADVATTWRPIKDIAFSGDGEPTACRLFRECVEIAAALRQQHRLDDTKIVLITNACYLTRPDVVAGLAIMDENNGEIWAKLDAGSEAHFSKVNRPKSPLQHVVDGIIAAARVRPVVVQSLFLGLDGEGPGETELAAFIGRLEEITRAGGRIKYVQVYTVARRPAEASVTALSGAELEDIAQLVRERTGLRVEVFRGMRP